MYSFYQILWLFLLYSVIGWTVEVAFVTLSTGRLVNRGFLNGPVCPIYGFGMIGVLLILEPVADQLFALFFGGMLLCTAVECFGGWILDKIFHMRWWDYSKQPFNFHGYICLGYSVMWGIGVVLVVRVIHPLIFGLVTSVPRSIGIALLVLLYLVYAVDLVVSLKTVIGISKSLGEMERIAKGLHQLGDEMSQLVGGAVLDTTELLGVDRETIEERSERFIEKSRERIARSVTELEERRAEFAEKSIAEFNERKEELQHRMEELEQKGLRLRQSIGSSRILRAFPGLRRDESRISLSEELKKLEHDWKHEKDTTEE